MDTVVVTHPLLRLLGVPSGMPMDASRLPFEIQMLDDYQFTASRGTRRCIACLEADG